MSIRRGLLAAILAAALLSPLAAATQATTGATVFAAASLKNALDEVVSAFARATGAGVKVSYGASSALARQIEEGAPTDVFVSADADWMDHLAARRLIAPASRIDLLTNHLVLIAPADSPVRLRIAPGMPLADALGRGRLAVAGPEVPAGRYARAALERLRIWPAVKDRLAPAENVRAALAFVAAGAAPLGIVYDTDARVEPRVRIVGFFPDSSHPPIVYPAALIAGRPNRTAEVFLRFLAGPKAAAIFARYGFRRL